MNDKSYIGLIQPKDRDYKQHGKIREIHIELRHDNISYALRTSIVPVIINSIKGEDKMSERTINYRIRKLTPTECYRLMGFEDKDVNAAREVGISNSSLYKQAGNSIITDCVELLAEHLYKAQYDDTYICRDECDKCKTPFPKDWMDENFTQPQI